MNTLVISLVLFLSANVIYAQEIIELKEARVESVPLFTQLSQDQNSFSIQIPDTYAGDFEQNPLGFLEKNVPLQELIAFSKKESYNSYVVTVRSKKGQLKADFDAAGNLVRSSYKFKDVALPYELMQQVYLENRGWAVVSNSFSGRAKKDEMAESSYHIILVKGDEKRKISLTGSEAIQNGLANIH